MTRKLKITITIISLMMGFSLWWYLYLPRAQQTRALNSAHQYLKTLNVMHEAVVCNRDSDGDGFSSCSYANKGVVRYLECDNAFIMNTHSCKKPGTTITASDSELM